MEKWGMYDYITILVFLFGGFIFERKLMSNFPKPIYPVECYSNYKGGYR